MTVIASPADTENSNASWRTPSCLESEGPEPCGRSPQALTPNRASVVDGMDKRDNQSNDTDTSQVTRVWQLPPSRSRPADAKSIRASRCCGPGCAPGVVRWPRTTSARTPLRQPACDVVAGRAGAPSRAWSGQAAAMLRSSARPASAVLAMRPGQGRRGRVRGISSRHRCGGASRSLDTLPGDPGREAFALHHDFTRLRGEASTGTASPSRSKCFRPLDWPQLWFGSYARLCGRSQAWPSLRLKRWTVFSPSGMAITMSPF